MTSLAGNNGQNNTTNGLYNESGNILNGDSCVSEEFKENMTVLNSCDKNIESNFISTNGTAKAQNVNNSESVIEDTENSYLAGKIDDRPSTKPIVPDHDQSPSKELETSKPTTDKLDDPITIDSDYPTKPITNHSDVKDDQVGKVSEMDTNLNNSSSNSSISSVCDKNEIEATNDNSFCEKNLDKNKIPISSIDLSKDKIVDKTDTDKKKSKIDRGTGDASFENLRPMAKILCNLGVDLARQQIYKDLIKVQIKKRNSDQLSEKEKKQLTKLSDAYDDLILKNEPYNLELHTCPKCNFSADTKLALEMHMEYPHQDLSGVYDCSFCDFKTRVPASYIYHYEAEHNLQGKIYSKLLFNSCTLCPFESNSKSHLIKHKNKCDRMFNLKRNLEPYPSDIDIPLKQIKTPISTISSSPHPPISMRPTLGSAQSAKLPITSTVKNPAISQAQQLVVGGHVYNLLMNSGSGQYVLQPSANTQVNGSSISQKITPQNKVLTSTNMLSGNKPTLPSSVLASVTQSQRVIRPKKESFESCEICGGSVKDRESLRGHFFWAHKIDIQKQVFDRYQPHIKCPDCTKSFWTSQGLTKHRHLSHPQSVNECRPKLFNCFLCKASGISNLLGHLNAEHSVTLQTMFKMRKCLCCGRDQMNEKVLENHLLKEHGSLFSPTSRQQSMGNLNSVTANTPVPVGLYQNKKTVNNFVPQTTKGSNANQQKSQLSKSPEKSESKAGINCHECDIVFSTAEAFDRHCRSVHMFKCHRCVQRWSSRPRLLAHLQSHHRNDKEKCQLCDDVVNIGRSYIRHLRMKHMKMCSVILNRLSQKTLGKYLSDHVNSSVSPSNSNRAKRRSSSSGLDSLVSPVSLSNGTTVES